MQYHWLEDGWPLEEEELKLSGRRLVRLMDWFLDGNQVMAYTVNMPGELIDENAEVRFCHISYYEVKKAAMNSKSKKAVGFDCIANELLKAEPVIHLLHKLFNTCFKNSLIPDQWRKVIINPIPKTAGYTTDPLNYCGLALQSCVYKIFSSVLNERLSRHLVTELADKQNGFWKHRSCLHHIFVLQTLVKNECLVRGKQIFSIFVDFRKAFDYVDRQLMYHRLKEANVNGPFLELIIQMYTNTVNVVKVNELFTDEIENNIGVKQGDNLSPGIFSQFINGLITKLKESHIGVNFSGDEKVCVLAYADDIVLLAESENELERLINITDEWCLKWRVSINQNKTKIIHFRRKTVRQMTHDFTNTSA